MTSHSGPGSLGPFEDCRELTWSAPLPELLRVRRVGEPAAVADVAAAVGEALAPLTGRVPEGARVAITAGSRGVASAPAIYRAVGERLRALGAEPFVVAAMGSHGGGNAEGRLGVLAHLGVTEEAVAMPVVSTDDLVEIAKDEEGAIPVAREVMEADLVLAVNRIKPHTDFHGPIESGLAKILAIGLGKQRGASAIHQGGPSRLGQRVVEVADAIVATGKVLGGLAVLEGDGHEVRRLAFVEPEGIGHAEESALLEEARADLAVLPFDQLDVLVIQELGKEVSGAGIDPNVLGRMRIEGEAEPGSPCFNVVVVLSLSAQTGGNGTGIGLADLTTLRVLEAIDLRTTYLNTLTSGLGGIRRGALPVVLPTDRDAICAALAGCGQPRPELRRLAWVRNTLAVSDLLVSTSLAEEVEAREDLEIVGGPSPMAFDGSGTFLGRSDA